MKRLNIKLLCGTIMVMLFMTSCDDILNESPRSDYTPEYFQTENGVRGGVTSMYAHLRYIYGNAYFYNTLETGTDEYTYAESADQNFLVMDISGEGDITSTNSRADVLWGNAFQNINTASGVIEFGGEVESISPSLLAEARFFRAFDYFMLVQTFGGVPLDLGAGELTFNSSPVRTSTRNTVPEVYTKAIFPDLEQAIQDLPVQPRVTGGVTKTVARLYLAKAYLTYAWWLENPDNIPTYPETDRTDPSGNSAQDYYQMAYDLAAEGINNPGPYGLQPTYYDVNVASNDRNNEMLLYADHTETSEFYNDASLTYGDGGGADNFAGWMAQWNYTVIRSGTDSGFNSNVSSVQREAAQSLGRPWTRMAPPIGVFEDTFEDKENDSRYDGTFTSTYRGNWNKGGVEQEVLYNANGMEVTPGDAILTFLDEPNSAIDYPDGQGRSNVGAGTLPGRSDFVIGPEGISRRAYPGLWKLGVYRTNDGDGLGQPNAASTRPFNIAKFSEFFFVAAEAAVKGAATSPTSGGQNYNGTDGSARALINVIRSRAGNWRYDNNANTTRDEDNSAAMVAATPATIDISYILEERSREYFGEGKRWYDLRRTQRWEDVAGTYEIAGSDYGDHDAQTVTRNIEPYHYLRPIPQGQLDGMQMNEAEKDEYQNPGYE
jgi:hypothetical protein